MIPAADRHGGITPLSVQNIHNIGRVGDPRLKPFCSFDFNRTEVREMAGKISNLYD